MNIEIASLTRFLTVMLLYFLIAYLTAVRRGGQPLLSWLILVLIQGASLYFWRDMYGFAKTIPVFAGWTDEVILPLTFVTLAAANLLLILLMGASGAGRQEVIQSEDWDDDEEPFEGEALTDILADIQNTEKDQPAAPIYASAPLESVTSVTRTVPVQPVTPEQPVVDLSAAVPLRNVAENVLDDQSIEPEDERIFESIRELIEAGDHDAAANYLKTIAFFGKKEALVKKAKQMLSELQGGGTLA